MMDGLGSSEGQAIYIGCAMHTRCNQCKHYNCLSRYYSIAVPMYPCTSSPIDYLKEVISNLQEQRHASYICVTMAYSDLVTCSSTKIVLL